MARAGTRTAGGNNKKKNVRGAPIACQRREGKKEGKVRRVEKQGVRALYRRKVREPSEKKRRSQPHGMKRKTANINWGEDEQSGGVYGFKGRESTNGPVVFEE